MLVAIVIVHNTTKQNNITNYHHVAITPGPPIPPLPHLQRFAEGVRGLDGILVPRQYPDLTSRRLLVTQWVEGERLVDSKADDVRRERVICNYIII